MATPEHPHDPECSKIYRFADERGSRQAYIACQVAIFHEGSADLSVYRLLLDAGYHVAILGVPPSPTLGRELVHRLRHGVRVAISQVVLDELRHRRKVVADASPWLERHIQIER